jgi:SusD/RagB-like outer membrane lipoprotein
LDKIEKSIIMKNALLISMMLLAVFFAGCSDILDVNVDPLATTQADPDLLLPSVLIGFSNNRNIELSGRMGNVVQYYEPRWGLYGDMALGASGNTTLNGNVWGINYGVYGYGIKELVLIELDAALKTPPNNNVIAQSKIMQAFIYFQLTGIFENIPFTEAVKFDIISPAYDQQETIFRGIIFMCDEAIELINQDPEAFQITSGDLIYNGDLDKWVKFANSLKLKTLMLLANKDIGVVDQINQLVTEPLINSLSDAAELKYYNNLGDYNPLWNLLNRYFGGINRNLWMASTTFMDVMNDLNDPRKSVYYDESSDATLVGSGNFGPAAPPGSYGVDTPSVISLNILRPDFPDRYITAAEIILMHAEAIARGWVSGGMSDADAKYREGVRSSMDYFDGKPGAITIEDKDNYLSSLPDLSSLSPADALRAIHLQLYINNFFRIPEGWIEWKRTKVPDLTIPQGSLISGILRRLLYPDSEIANPNRPSNSSLDYPMWFEN